MLRRQLQADDARGFFYVVRVFVFTLHARLIHARRNGSARIEAHSASPPRTRLEEPGAIA